jgi:hypothetical protein
LRDKAILLALHGAMATTKCDDAGVLTGSSVDQSLLLKHSQWSKLVWPTCSDAIAYRGRAAATCVCSGWFHPYRSGLRPARQCVPCHGAGGDLHFKRFLLPLFTLCSLFVQHCTLMQCYRTYPHIDMVETGERVATQLLDWIDEMDKVGIFFLFDLCVHPSVCQC